MGHTPNDRSRSFPPAGHINPQSGPCPTAEPAERTERTCVRKRMQTGVGQKILTTVKHHLEMHTLGLVE